MLRKHRHDEPVVTRDEGRDGGDGSDPGAGAPRPTVGMETLTGEKVAGQNGYSLVLHRLVVVDP